MAAATIGHYHHRACCRGTVIFARWFPIVLRVCFRISLDRNRLRRLSPPRTARKFTKTSPAAISATHDRPSSCRPSLVAEWFVPFDPPFDKTSRYAAAGTADPRMSLSTSRSVATRKRGDVYLAGVVAVIKKFDSRFSLIPHPPHQT